MKKKKNKTTTKNSYSVTIPTSLSKGFDQKEYEEQKRKNPLEELGGIGVPSIGDGK